MKRLRIFLLTLGLALLLTTSCSRHFAEYDNMQFYELTKSVDTTYIRNNNIRYRLIHAYGAYYFLEAQFTLPTYEGDSVPCWVPIEKFHKLKND